MRRLLRAIVILLAGLFIGVNIVAAMQAYHMTHFIPGGSRIEEQLNRPFPQRLWPLIAGVSTPRPENRSTPAQHNLTYDTVTIPISNDEWLEAWQVVHPNPRGIIIMFVGIGGAKEGALTPAAYFYQFGYSALLVDFRGTGGSSGSDTTIGVREAEDVIAAFSYANQQWPTLPKIGYGISMGSAALMRAVAVEGLQPAALILEGPFDNLLTTTRHRFHAVGLPGSPFAELLVFWGSVQIGANGFAHNPVEYARAITCPTLLTHGERDPWIYPEEMQAIADAMPSKPQTITFTGQGHQMPFVYGDAALWARSMRAFLDEETGT